MTGAGVVWEWDCLRCRNHRRDIAGYCRTCGEFTGACAAGRRIRWTDEDFTRRWLDACDWRGTEPWVFPWSAADQRAAKAAWAAAVAAMPSPPPWWKFWREAPPQPPEPDYEDRVLLCHGHARDAEKVFAGDLGIRPLAPLAGRP